MGGGWEGYFEGGGREEVEGGGGGRGVGEGSGVESVEDDQADYTEEAVSCPETDTGLWSFSKRVVI